MGSERLVNKMVWTNFVSSKVKIISSFDKNRIQKRLKIIKTKFISGLIVQRIE